MPVNIPEGSQILTTYVDRKLRDRVKHAEIKRGVKLPIVIDEALRLWVEAQR
jgi:hypothetical protein